MNMLLKTPISLAIVATLAGCAVVDHTVAKYDAQKSQNDTDERFNAAMQAPTSNRVIDSEGIWVNKRSVSLKEEVLPAVFKMPMTVGFETRSSLRDVANMVSRETGLRFSFAPDIAKEVELQTLNAGFRNEGDLRALLNQLTAQANLSWKYRGGAVEVFRFDTQVFQIAVLPGSTELSSSVGNRTASGGSGGSASTSSGQDVKYAVKLEFWKGLQNDLKNLMSRDGKDASFTVSETTNTITATGTLPTLAAVESYVKDLNASRTRQVAIEVKAYTIDASSGRDFGLNWDLAYTQLAKDLGVTAVTPAVSNTALGVLSAVLGPSANSRFANSKLMMNALSTLGTTNIAVESTQMVLSGETVPVNSMREVNYLSEVTTSAVANAGTQTSLKQSTVTEGFSMTVLPVVLSGDSIMMKGLLDISSIDRIDTVSSGGQTIATPQRSTRSLPMTVYLKSGETYVYGLREALSSFQDSGLTGTALINTLTGGQHGSKESKKTIVVTVTPYIINPKR
jgi:type IVB pilus formation R64 PilN family outer membrane protein